MRKSQLNPSVTAVMVTGKSIERVKFARTAVTSFLEQTYPNKKLLIINTGPCDILDRERLNIEEKRLFVNNDVTLGKLRNMAFDLTDSDFLIQWDDDDWYHPERIAYQVSGIASSGSSVFLNNQIRYSFERDTAIVYSNGPIHGTVLHPRKIRQRYSPLKRSEDTVFMKILPNRVVMDNEPKMYIRFYHGSNTWDELHIMGRASHDDVKGQRLRFDSCSPDNKIYLSKVLNDHYSWVGKLNETKSDLPGL